MNRREALSAVGILLGGTIVGAEAFLSGCNTATQKNGLFAAEDIVFLDEVGETIIPATASSPGAKASKIGEFMRTIVTDCYSDGEQKAFVDGLVKLQDSCRKKYNKSFAALSAPERKEFLTVLDKEAKDFVKTDDYKTKKAAFDKQQDDWQKAEESKKDFGASHLREKFPPHYFAMIKQLTIWGYFTSEIGMTQALRYLETPGKFDGAYPYKKGDKAWAIGGFFG